ncbi:pyrroloquinoline quinone biosynthesis peptide chaperone PqqD [Robbsia sp. Bb-Pol-6]|uniref:Pyrroloquinoline quinone biosynthesis peptide chaperone PqqD n=1 Tax=Robbsia betulipollinis TaxID=2981849 RepID=A0ABT3ZMT4_9BURK|nr:pyrroloquinoline quinone biosynthesis peptide chaperone PqqD [Robbsia betulipollinis]MCY0387777.1 pyrroloquinoline quinone biosynthesis peptide chaperone PqqD [Robbsia betulipollinis]
MNPASPASPHLQLKPRFRLQWEPAQNAHVLLYPEGMVKLNLSSAEILKRCDGTRDLAKIVEDIEAAFNTENLGDEVRGFIGEAQRRGWLE